MSCDTCLAVRRGLISLTGLRQTIGVHIPHKSITDQYVQGPQLWKPLRYTETMMKVEVQGRRTIKPTEASEMHPNPLPLSSADFAAPVMYVQLMYAFTSPTPPTTLLEEALARALSEYREWAGRLVQDADGRPAIQLNDQGVAFIEAAAGGPLEEAMPFDCTALLSQLFPPHNGVSELLLIQLTRFACGGLVIGVAWHHYVADGASVRLFMRSWGQIARGQPMRPLPARDRSVLMARDPPRPAFDHLEYCNLPLPASRPWALVYKKFHFRAEFLKDVRDSASRNAEKAYSRFESLVGHMWRRVCMARGLAEEVETKLRFPVNVRSILNPPLPPQYFGNAICETLTAPTTVKALVKRPLAYAANLIHDAVTRIDEEYVRSSLDFLEIHRSRQQPVPADGLTVVSPNVMATSTVNLPTYELDFGGGPPLYAGPLGLPVEGQMLIFPSYTKDGSMDLIISLFELHAAKLEQICYAI